MKNKILKIILIGFLLTTGFWLPSYCQLKTASADTTETFYAHAVLQADPHANGDSPGRLLVQFPLPSISQLRQSPSARTYLRYYLADSLREIAYAYRKDSLRGAALIVSVFGSPFDSVTRWGGIHGDDYLLTRMAPKILDASLCEFFLAERIRYNCQEKYYETALQIWQDYQIRFPNGEHRDSCHREIARLSEAIARNSQDTKIVLHESGDNPSLRDILAPYKGKIVYLDIWGSWCGPCRQEMAHVPALKKQFQGKDVVFLYLDMDGSEARDRWINFVRMEAIAGEHYRFSADQMEKIWQRLIPGKNTIRKYPSYFIFDRKGEPMVAKVLRPSDREALYRQLETALKQGK